MLEASQAPMEARGHVLPSKLRDRLDHLLTWSSLAYGYYAAAIGAALSRDELEIAVGGEAIVLALVDFLWSGARRSLGWALVITGALAPLIGWGTAPLFWYKAGLFTEAFWTSMALGVAVGVPLLLMGRHVLKRPAPPQMGPDPRWFRVGRHVIRGGLLLVVLGFRGGQWDSGVLLVCFGAALVLASIIIALPRRFGVTAEGQGQFLLTLGFIAIMITLIAGALSGSHMSGSEALVGIVPAGVLCVVGLVMMVVRSRRRARADRSPP